MAEINVTVRQVGASTSEAEIRTHKVLVDRPEARGGVDKGAMGGELFLASLGGCFMSNLLAAIKARDMKVSVMVVSVAGTLEGTPPRFSAISMIVTGVYPDRTEMEKLVGMSEKACIVSNTLRESVNLTVTLED